MDISQDIQHQLIGDIYDASMNPALWQPVLGKIAELWDARMANLLVGDKLNPQAQVVFSHGTTAEETKLFYQGGFATQDMELSFKWMSHGLSLGTTAANHTLFGGLDNFKAAAGDLYENFYRKIDIAYQLGSMLELTDFRFSSIGISRSESRGGFTDDAVLAARQLTPHLRRALQIHRQLMHVKKQNERLYAMLDRMVAGVMLVNANGRVCYANPAAEKLLGENNALGVSARYGLKAEDATEGHALKTLLDGAIKTGLRERHRLLPDDSPAGGVIGIGNERGKVPLMLTVTPLSEMSGYEDLASDGIAAGIFITNPAASRVLATHLLQKSFLLGERECDVCQAFLNCATLEGVADALGISMNTVRSYMKVIYEKTGHRSQAELMKLLMGMTLDFEHIR